ncbi:MAG TPA: alpha-glucosidase, partial [Streptomyces sp.]|nr:alpha-glucosidase [Streptomyces sp.]
VQAQREDPSSALRVVRSALSARRSRSLRDAPWPVWLSCPEGVLAFRRGGVTCVMNTGHEPLLLDEWGSRLLAGSRELDEHGRLPSPGTAWLH